MFARREKSISMAKVVVLGNSGVGKTSIVLQFAQEIFRRETEATIGASYVTKEVITTRGPFTLHIWDTAGQERYKSVVPMYLRGCRAALIVFAQDNKESLDNISSWIDLLKDIQKEDVLIAIVGNKTDLGDSQIIEGGREFARDHGYEFFETTATDGTTIKPVFHWIAEHLASTTPASDPTPSVNPHVQKSGCC